MSRERKVDGSIFDIVSNTIKYDITIHIYINYCMLSLINLIYNLNDKGHYAEIYTLVTNYSILLLFYILYLLVLCTLTKLYKI